MLKSLEVSNFAIIEDLHVDFLNNMSVLTGETGAGKSLIIDSITLLLGGRADLDMIRYGFDRAYIKGVFDTTDYLNNILSNMGINILDDIVIEREITTSSKNKIKINNTNITLQMLKDFSVNLAIINSQNDTFKLFNKDNYIELVDPENDDKFDKLKNKYTLKLYEYNNKYEVYNKVLKNKNDLSKEKEFLEYNVKELESLSLEEDIDIKLEDEINRLSHFDKIKKNLCDAMNYISGEVNIIDQIYNIKEAIDNISSYDKKYEDIKERLDDIYYNLDDITSNISSDFDNLDYDEEEFNNLIERLNEINKAKDKYKMNVNELISYLSDAKLKLEMATNYDDVLNEKKNDLIKSFEELKNTSIELSNYRKKICKNIEDGIIKEVYDLGLINTRFEIKFMNIDLSDPFNKSIFKSNGIDDIDLLISFNKGEPLKPLYKVASGGEMSRVMLAFRSYFSKDSKLQLIVFDEIDTGVDGEIAIKIAKKMHNISKYMQVLCITHLPSVASIGDNHYHIYKEEIDNRTYTRINLLNMDERIKEVAVMLSGNKVSLYALDAAKEMIGDLRNDN